MNDLPVKWKNTGWAEELRLKHSKTRKERKEVKKGKEVKDA